MLPPGPSHGEMAFHLQGEAHSHLCGEAFSDLPSSKKPSSCCSALQRPPVLLCAATTVWDDLSIAHLSLVCLAPLGARSGQALGL